MFVKEQVWAALSPVGKWLALAVGWKPQPVKTRRARAQWRGGLEERGGRVTRPR